MTFRAPGWHFNRVFINPGIIWLKTNFSLCLLGYLWSENICEHISWLFRFCILWGFLLPFLCLRRHTPVWSWLLWTPRFKGSFSLSLPSILGWHMCATTPNYVDFSLGLLPFSLTFIEIILCILLLSVLWFLLAVGTVLLSVCELDTN